LIVVKELFLMVDYVKREIVVSHNPEWITMDVGRKEIT